MLVTIIGKEVKSGIYEKKEYVSRKIYVSTKNFGNDKELISVEGQKVYALTSKIAEEKFNNLEIGKQYNIALYYNGKSYVCNEVFAENKEK